MAVLAGHDFLAPFEVDKLLQIRTSRMKQMSGLNVTSGIDKKLRDGPMKIDKLGLEGDEHDLTFHGGPDKAILGYCSSHYPNWRSSYPEQADRFVPGGFGENFVTEHMNERNVCIGDVVAVGPEVLLQVSLPRQPCYKLNHRFSIKKFAPLTYKSSRTGWYYRVLREGSVSVGDEIRLVERKWPSWTIERIQEYLHRCTDNAEMNEEISQIEALGSEARNQFKRRVAKAKKAPDEAPKEVWRDFKIVRREMETPRILSLSFEPTDPELHLKEEYVGAHVRVKLPNGLLRSYSIAGAGGDGHTIGRRLDLGIALDEKSRGGSKYLHESAQIGDIIQLGSITTSVPAVGSASNHLFIVGGVGITAFLGLAEAYNSVNWNVEMHYAVRSSEETPYRERIEALGDRVTIYDKAKGQRMDVKKILSDMTWNSQVYVCGPDRMMKAASEAIAELGISSNEAHFEAFAADVTGDPFEAEVVNCDGKVVQVKENESLLEALRREFDDVPSSCEVGNCGTCKVTLKSGRVDHRGTALATEEMTSAMLSCVSRGIGHIAIEI